MIRYGEEECFVKAEFVVPSESFAVKMLEEMDIETDGEIIISRKFSETGKNSIKINGNTVTVKIGEVTHPMLPEHHIEWIILETKKGVQIKYLEAGDAPEAKFELVDDEAVAAYEYCNLHGLWKKDLI